MGELSKSLGEKGERIVNFVFEAILDFNSLQENYSINCVKGVKHKEKNAKSNKVSHGIDGLISYKSPIEDHSLNIGLISSKFTGAKYPSNPSTIFKSHLKDLAQTLECFNNSKLKNDINRNFEEVTKTETFGILVWLSDASDLDFDVLPRLEHIQIASDLSFDKIIVLDNKRVNFLYDSIYRTKEVLGENNVRFVYHNSGSNLLSIQEQSYGRVFPLTYLYSDLIALRTVRDNKISLNIFINDEFDEAQFIQVLSFAKSFDHLNSIDKIILSYRVYNSVIHENFVKDKLVRFPNYRLNENLEILKFPSDFRN